MDKYFLNACVQCGAAFDLNFRLPQSLPCGHTVCSFCANHSGVPSGCAQCPFCMTPVCGGPHSLPLDWTIIQMLKRVEDERKVAESAAQSPKSILCPENRERDLCYMPSHSGIYPGYYVETMKFQDVSLANNKPSNSEAVPKRKSSDAELVERMKRLNVSEGDTRTTGTGINNGYKVDREGNNTMVLDDY